jgi:hypothetical protein
MRVPCTPRAPGVRPEHQLTRRVSEATLPASLSRRASRTVMKARYPWARSVAPRSLTGRTTVGPRSARTSRVSRAPMCHARTHAHLEAIAEAACVANLRLALLVADLAAQPKLLLAVPRERLLRRDTCAPPTHSPAAHARCEPAHLDCALGLLLFLKLLGVDVEQCRRARLLRACSVPRAPRRLCACKQSLPTWQQRPRQGQRRQHGQEERQPGRSAWPLS